jgi:uncharacterized protein (DUF2164 family)
MAIELTQHEIEGIIPSLQKFFHEELEHDISGMRAKQTLDYILKEIAPFAYNKGIRDAESYFRNKVEDLSATCFEDGLTYWVSKKKRNQ